MLHEPAGANRKGFRTALRDSVHSYAEALRNSDPSAYEPFLFETGHAEEASGGR